MLNLLTLAIFLLVVGLAWLSAQALLKPRPKRVISLPLPGLSLGNEAGESDERSDAWIESLASQVPQSLSTTEELDRIFVVPADTSPRRGRDFSRCAMVW